MAEKTRSFMRQRRWSLSALHTMIALHLAVLAALFAPGLPPAMAQQSLPLEVQVDLALVELERAVGSEDHDSVLGLIDRLRTLSPASGAGDLLFFEAEAAMATGDLDRAETSLTQFVSTVGRGSELYPSALELLLDLPRLREEAQAEQLAAQQAELERVRAIEREEQRAAEAERARQAAARTAALRAEERAVLNSLATIRDVRFLLHSRYGNNFELPAPTTLDNPLTSAERAWLNRLPISGTRDFVDREVLQHVRRYTFRPRTAEGVVYDRLITDDWYTYLTSNGKECRASTVADEFPDGSLFIRPTITVSYNTDWDRSSIGMSLLWPNPFRTDRPITLSVADTTHRLVLGSGGETFVPEGNWGSFTRALQAGRRIEVTGTDIYTNQTLTIGFSAIGFTATLRRIALLCDRTPELGRWLNL